jgi:hypothetical protein
VHAVEKVVCKVVNTSILEIYGVEEELVAAIVVWLEIIFISLMS